MNRPIAETFLPQYNMTAMIFVVGLASQVPRREPSPGSGVLGQRQMHCQLQGWASSGGARLARDLQAFCCALRCSYSSRLNT